MCGNLDLNWVYCNIFPASIENIEGNVKSLYDKYTNRGKFSKGSLAYWDKCKQFLKDGNQLFNDIGQFLF